jgi:DnaJ family protein C protein 9
MEEAKTRKKQSKAQPTIEIESNQEMENEDDQDASDEESKTTLYDLLNVPKTATVAEIKKSYRALALKLHPDKNKEDAEATRNFQKINEAYQILIDPEKRKIYDETGSIEDGDLASFGEAYRYYRSMYKKIEKEDIEDFAKKYRYSDEETQDVMNFYTQSKGDVTLMLEHIMLSENEDVDRFIGLIEEKIRNNELKKYKNWEKTKDRIKLLPDESEEVQKQQEAELKELTSNILAKYHKQGNFFDALEKKYGGGKSKKSEYDIDDEAFEQIQRNMLNKDQNKRKGKVNGSEKGRKKLKN